jgi:hypothetical protein
MAWFIRAQQQKHRLVRHERKMGGASRGLYSSFEMLYFVLDSVISY